MITYFPKPYLDELLYSILARFCVHTGETSPKRILDQLFSDRKVIAVVDLPSHIEQLLKNVDDLWLISEVEVIYNYTLFPLYAAFIPEKRKEVVLKDLIRDCGANIHTRIGISASVVSPPGFLRYCPICNEEAKLKNGEFYWKRLFQVTGVLICPIHQCILQDSLVAYRNEHRHQFFASNPSNCSGESKQNDYDIKIDKLLKLTIKIQDLLGLGPIVSPSFQQWTLYYKKLAVEHDCVNGKKLDHLEISERICRFWGRQFMADMNCVPEVSDTCWVKSMFRKHRKSFSYLQHLLVWEVFEPEKTVSEIIKIVINFPKIDSKKGYTQCQVLDSEVSFFRNKWLGLIENNKEYGSKEIRALPEAKRIYAWLYRHDRIWLLETNLAIRKSTVSINKRVDWHHRDRTIVRKLLHRQKTVVSNLESPLRSRNWFLGKLSNRASIEKNILKLPLCQRFFTKYVETPEEFQLRRCLAYVIYCFKNELPIRTWEVERATGLDKKHVLPVAKKFLQGIEEISSEQEAIKSYQEWVKVSRIW